MWPSLWQWESGRSYPLKKDQGVLRHLLIQMVGPTHKLDNLRARKGARQHASFCRESRRAPHFRTVAG